MTIKIDSEIELKQLEQSNSLEIFNLIDSQREYLGKWLPFVAQTHKVADTERFVQAIINAPADSLDYVFTIRKNDEFIGLIGFKGTDKQNKKTEIGYWLSEAQQKQGIVTKSVDKLCDLAFNKMGINRIVIKCAVGNSSSKNIPKRLGFMFEGIERQGELLTDGGYTDIEIYSLLRSDENSREYSK